MHQIPLPVQKVHLYGLLCLVAIGCFLIMSTFLNFLNLHVVQICIADISEKNTFWVSLSTTKPSRKRNGYNCVKDSSLSVTGVCVSKQQQQHLPETKQDRFRKVTYATCAPYRVSQFTHPSAYPHTPLLSSSHSLLTPSLYLFHTVALFIFKSPCKLLPRRASEKNTKFRMTVQLPTRACSDGELK